MTDEECVQLFGEGFWITDCACGFGFTSCQDFHLLKSLLGVHVAEFCFQFVFIVQFGFENLVPYVPVCCLEAGPVLVPEGFVFFLQALFNLRSNPGFGIGIYPYCFRWDCGAYAEFDVVCDDRNPVIQIPIKCVPVGAGQGAL